MISFIIPVYNKGAVLYKTLTSLIRHLNQATLTDYEIIIINDGSTDDTFSQAVRFKKFNGDTQKIKIYHYTRNVGKGFAMRYGFSQSHGDPVVFLDGDMDIDTSQVVNAISIYKRLQPDMVIGSKYHHQSRIYYPVNRFLYSLVLKGMIRLLFHLKVSDTQVGLKIFQRSVLEKVLPRIIIKRFAVDLEILTVAHMMGFHKILEVPVVIRHTSANRSTIDLWAVKNFCVDIVAIFYRKYFLRFYVKKKGAIASTWNPSFTIQSA